MGRTEVKEDLGRRIVKVSSLEFIRNVILSSLADYKDTDIQPDSIQTSIVQNDGTGPAMVEYTIKNKENLFGKLFADESGRHVYKVLSKLWEQGFTRGHRYRVPEPVCFVDEYNLVVMKQAQGECLASYLDQDFEQAVKGIREAARWLQKLHEFPFRIGSIDQPWYMFRKLSDRISKATAAHPQEVKFLNSMLDKMKELVRQYPEVDTVQIHGQFRPIHVFLSSDTVTAIDLDRSHPADPSKDVAEFIHRLRTTIHRRSDGMDQADILTEAFIEEYASRDFSRLLQVPFHLGFHVLVSLCRHMKALNRNDPEWLPTIDFYSKEFEHAVSGRFIT